MSRVVTLVLLDRDGSPLGALPPYEVALPYWQEMSDVVPAARERYGVDVDVLRLLAHERPQPHGGAVTYLAQVRERPARELAPVRVDLRGHPLRAPWAAPGGPRASLAWAADALGRLGYRVESAAQQRTWNLSAIWRLDLARADDGAPETAWLKQVPPFMRHEAAVLRWLGLAAPGTAAPLLATGEEGRELLAHVPGDDWYDADLAARRAIAETAHRVQRRALADVDGLLAAGVPDCRGTALIARVRVAARRHGAGILGLERVLDDLPARLAAVSACGVPDTLVHGDLHGGNARGVEGRPVLVDWGDSFVGQPGFDILVLASGLPPAGASDLIAGWARRWRADAPGCEPDRALELLRPVAALRGAAVYAGFLAGIEPSEHPFHAADVPACLREAVELSG